MVTESINVLVEWLGPTGGMYWYTKTLLWTVAWLVMIGGPALLATLALEWVDARLKTRRHERAV